MSFIIAEHERCFGQYQNRYRLDDYLPLLEIRSRAFFNAAPVRQNIPPEVLQRWQEERTDHKTIIAFLKAQSGAEAPGIKDPVRIRAVDLHEYDTLKEAAYVERGDYGAGEDPGKTAEDPDLCPVS